VTGFVRGVTRPSETLYRKVGRRYVPHAAMYDVSFSGIVPLGNWLVMAGTGGTCTVPVSSEEAAEEGARRTARLALRVEAEILSRRISSAILAYEKAAKGSCCALDTGKAVVAELGRIAAEKVARL
jgi:hypothetical protein